MDRPIPSMRMVANKDDLIKLLQAELTEHEVTRKELERQIEELKIESPYCPVCGSCGEDGCCKAERCLYPEIKSEFVKEMRLERIQLESENAALKAQVKELEEYKFMYEGLCK